MDLNVAKSAWAITCINLQIIIKGPVNVKIISADGVHYYKLLNGFKWTLKRKTKSNSL